jgi:hypothetical protein
VPIAQQLFHYPEAFFLKLGDEIRASRAPHVLRLPAAPGVRRCIDARLLKHVLLCLTAASKYFDRNGRGWMQHNVYIAGEKFPGGVEPNKAEGVNASLLSVDLPIILRRLGATLPQEQPQQGRLHGYT